MKMLCIVMLAASLQISARGYSQGISITLKNEPLEKLFTAVEQQTNFSFVYSKEAMELSKPVTIDAKSETLENILKLGFTNQPLTYSIVEKFIIVKVADKKTEAAVLDHDVFGRVVNENGEGVVDTITETGTTNAVSTDADGYFQLKDADENATLVVTGVGIETIEIKVDGRSNVSISVKTKITGLTEVIVNKGYYSTSQKLNTGNVAKVTSDIISKQPIGNPIAALQGRVPGLYIQQSSGVPGGDFRIQLRGQNSVANRNDPLYIVDGVPFTSTSLSNSSLNLGAGVPNSPFNSINPSDVESIEVLKDADATAIYGSRGANGVILITTKKGKAGKTQVNVNIYAGGGKITRTMNLLNTQQYLQMRREAFKNDAVATYPSNAYDINGRWDTTRYTDWQNVLLGGAANILDAQASLSGGSANTQFLIGSGYHKETTVFPGDYGDQKGSVHFNLANTSTNNKLKIVLSASYLVDKNQLPQVDLINYINLPPNAPAIYDSTGQLNWEGSTWQNPFKYIKQKNKSTIDNLIANLQLSYQLLSGLQLRSSFGFNNIQMRQIITSPLTFFNPAIWPSVQAEGDFANNNIKTWIIEPQLNYRRKVGIGLLDAILGATFQQNRQNGLGQAAFGFPSDVLIENIQAASQVYTVSSTNTLYKYNAIFGRFNYNIREKYLLNLTGRRDGSSRFGPGKQFANFGAVGLGWIFSNEKFIQKKIPFLSYGKIRSSYGITGNDQIGDYQYLSTYSPYTFPYQGITGLLPNNLYNPDYHWEKNKKLEIGIELGFLKDRIYLSSSFYRNRSSDQLVGFSLPSITGFTSITTNLPATIENSGWEIELNAYNLKSKNLSWTTSVNLTIPKNKLVDYPNLAGSAYANRYVVGQSLFIQKVYHFTGVDPQTGIYTFQDLDRNGIYNNADRIPVFVGQKFYGGLQNSFKYKDWQLEVFFQFVKQAGYNYVMNFILPGARGQSNQPDIVLSRWQGPGHNSNIQAFSQDLSSLKYTAYTMMQSSDNAISDASFIRMKNLSISYQLPTGLIQKFHLQNIRFYVQGQNVFTITNYLGFDPESKGLLPPIKMLTAGIQITL